MGRASPPHADRESGARPGASSARSRREQRSPGRLRSRGATALTEPSVAALLEDTARRFADDRALLWHGGELSWRELDRRAGGIARALAGDGIGPDDRVAISLAPGWPFVTALLGALKRGAAAAPLNPLLTAEEQLRIETHLGARHVIRHAAGHEAEWPASPPGRTALILYTSGSTGAPKGAMLSHRALGFALRSWAAPVMALTPDDVVLAALPPSHSFGLCGALLAPLLVGARVVLLERFTPEDALRAMTRHRVTVLPAVATMFRRMLDSPAWARADLSSLRLAVSGAAPCPWPLASEWQRRTGVRILRGYGMTELFRPVSYLAEDPEERPDAIGRPVPGVDVRIVGEAGADRAVGEAGELWIRSPAAMDGYLGAAEETEAVLADGWFRTSDLATMSADGFVSIVGRARELILRGGYSVVPAEVEAALLTHPAILEAAVIGVPHPDLGEEIAAFVTVRPGSAPTAEELAAHCRTRLAAYKFPRQVTIVRDLPRTATGKVIKAGLRGG
jgi:long-chain acyl-CoA synthetase